MGEPRQAKNKKQKQRNWPQEQNSWPSTVWKKDNKSEEVIAEGQKPQSWQEKKGHFWNDENTPWKGMHSVQDQLVRSEVESRKNKSTWSRLEAREMLFPKLERVNQVTKLQWPKQSSPLHLFCSIRMYSVGVCHVRDCPDATSHVWNREEPRPSSIYCILLQGWSTFQQSEQHQEKGSGKLPLKSWTEHPDWSCHQNRRNR